MYLEELAPYATAYDLRRTETHPVMGEIYTVQLAFRLPEQFAQELFRILRERRANQQAFDGAYRPPSRVADAFRTLASSMEVASDIVRAAYNDPPYPTYYGVQQTPKTLEQARAEGRRARMIRRLPTRVNNGTRGSYDVVDDIAKALAPPPPPPTRFRLLELSEPTRVDKHGNRVLPDTTPEPEMRFRELEIE